MKVAKYYNNSDVRLEEMPIPEISEKEILVKVKACGICGSDVLEWYRIKKAPLVLGHEMTGVVEKVGAEVGDFKEGASVFVSHHVPCMECKYCKAGKETVCDTLRSTNFYPGGFAEYVRVPEINVGLGTYKLPEEVSFEEGTFIEPLGCVVRAQRKAGIKENDTVLVLGSGISGLLHIQLAKEKGASRVVSTDINEYRLEAARKFGADLALNASEEIKEKFDHIIICTGAPSAVEQAVNALDRGGTLMFFAVPSPDEKTELPLNELWRDNVSIMTSYAAAPRDLEEAIALIKDKKVNVKDMITHKLPLEDAQKGFELTAKAGESLKVILKP